MSASMVVQQYWQLTRALILPLRAVRWLLCAVMMLAVAGSAIFWWAGEPTLLMFSSAVGLVLILVVSMVVPSQMLAMASSKQLSWIPGFREKSCLLVMLLIFGLAAFGSYGLILTQENTADFFTLVAVGFLYISFVVVLLIVTGAYLRHFQVLSFAFIWGGFIAAEYLLQVAPTIILIMAATIWSGFYLWWRQWEPRYHLVNYMTLSQVRIKELQEQQQGLMQPYGHYFSAVPNSMLGTLLLASSDGYKALAKRELGHLVLIALTICLLLFLMRSGSGDPLRMMAPLFLFIYIVSRSFQLQLNYYRNLYRLWLMFSYSRVAIFNYLERQYVAHMLIALVPLGLITILINGLLGDTGIDAGLLIATFLIGVLLSIQLFYLGWVIYIKSAASVTWFNWVVPLLTTACMLTMTYLNFLWGWHVRQSAHDYGLLCVILVPILFLVRLWALRSWHKINFYRAKN